MKARILTMLIVLAVLVSGITACIPKGGNLVKVMKLAPRDTPMVMCMDFEAMEEDPDFSIIYDSTISGLSYVLLDYVDIDVSAISASAMFETDDWDNILVLIGDFNLEDIHDTLIEEDFVEGEYQGVEIWINDFDDALAFIDNMIVFSDSSDIVEACIRRYKNEESSMYDNEDMKAVADKLPAGVISIVFGPDEMYKVEALAGGMCLRNSTSGDEVLDITGWYKFNSEASAEDAMTEDLEDDWGWEFGATDVDDARLSGSFIELTGEMEIPEIW